MSYRLSRSCSIGTYHDACSRSLGYPQKKRGRRATNLHQEKERHGISGDVAHRRDLASNSREFRVSDSTLDMWQNTHRLQRVVDEASKRNRHALNLGDIKLTLASARHASAAVTSGSLHFQSSNVHARADYFTVGYLTYAPCVQTSLFAYMG